MANADSDFDLKTRVLPLLAVANLPVEVIFRLTATVVHTSTHTEEASMPIPQTLRIRAPKGSRRLFSTN